MNEIQTAKKIILVLIALLYSLVRMGLRIAFREGVGSAAPTELILRFVYVYPGFHFGLCPHYTLGFEEVSCLRHSILPSHKSITPIPPLKSNNTPIQNPTTYSLKFNNTHILAMSPERAILIRSPGRNEGKARYGTLGAQRAKAI